MMADTVLLKMSDLEKINEAILKRDKLIKQLADALSWYRDKPFHCSSKCCGLCTEYSSCRSRINTKLCEKAREILR